MTNNQAHVWQTQDGRLIPINELTDDHLLNIAKVIVRRAKVNFIHNAIAMLQVADIPDRVADEIITGGDHEYGAQEHWHMLVNDPRYVVINEELKRRGISNFDFEEDRDWVFEPSSEWYP